MATSTGFQLEGGRIPGERIATDIETSNSSSFTTTEVELQTVTASVVDGRTYRVRWVAAFDSGGADNEIKAAIREDDVSGTELQVRHITIPVTNRHIGVIVEAEYTADATEDKTFSFTGQRTTGGNSCLLHADATRPVYAYVDYIRG